MIIPHKRAELFRNYQQAIFYSNKYSQQERRYYFYLLLRPLLEFLKDRLEGSLEPDEIESELFLLSVKVFDGYDKTKSSIIPYLENFLPWHIKNLHRQVDKMSSDIQIEIQEEPLYIDEEFYWKSILFQDRYVGKCFTRSEKYFIHRIIESDEKDLKTSTLARSLNIKRGKMKRMLHDLEEVFIKLEEINVRH